MLFCFIKVECAQCTKNRCKSKLNIQIMQIWLTDGENVGVISVWEKYFFMKRREEVKE